MSRARVVGHAILVLCAMAFQVRAGTCPADGGAFQPFYTDAAPFEAAIADTADMPSSIAALSGLTIPHHLVAAHLMAEGLRLSAGHRYQRIILLFPDHFRALDRPFGTLRSGFDTVLGAVGTDRFSVDSLLAQRQLGLEEQCALADDHGLRALLPFVSRFHPGTAIVPIGVAARSTRADWDRLVEALAPLAGSETLILQSTDFSHYLPHYRARQHDQQTLNVLASGSLDLLAGLTQPDHRDSLGAMYVQAALQQRAHRATPQVLASENMQQYADSAIDETTSYLTIGYMANDAAELQPQDSRASVVFFAGDTFFGREMSAVLADADATERVEAAILALTGGAPLILNLEGVLLPDVPSNIDHMVLAMPRDLAIDWLRRLNVSGASLANNHSTDIGETGFAETTAALDGAGIRWFGQGGRLDLPGLAVVGLTDIDSNATRRADLLDGAMLDNLVIEDGTVPVVAFVHWGREYVTVPRPRERYLAEEMRRRGVAAIIGAHAHRASGAIDVVGGDTALLYSLGNFLFDQRSDKSSGALAKVTIFPQGTIHVRRIGIPNLFELALPQ